MYPNYTTQDIPYGYCKCGCGQKTALAKQNDPKMGYIKDEPVRFRAGHNGGMKLAIASRTKHGMSGTPEYVEWRAVKQRCYDAAAINYRNYGGRGIQMCDAWRDEFLAFHAYVSSLPGYGTPGYTLDRIDNDGNYEPGNVRWASRNTQSNNTRLNRYIEFHNEVHTATEWGRILGISGRLINQRVRNGWEIERALTTPSMFK